MGINRWLSWYSQLHSASVGQWGGGGYVLLMQLFIAILSLCSRTIYYVPNAAY